MRRRIGKRQVILSVVALLLVILLGWRFCPHSFEKVISTGLGAITSLACTATIAGVENNGTAFIHSYKLQSLTEEDENFDAIMQILGASKYRQDFRNLLPWELTSVGSDGTHDGKSVNILLVWGNAENENCYLTFHSDSVVVVSVGNDGGLLIYHPTNDKVLDKLVDYIQTHGNAN